MKERLLKRIRHGVLNDGQMEVDGNELALSLADDLEKMFNTRLGTVLIDPDYGLPDFNDMFSSYQAPDSEQIGRMLHDLVSRHEPRLKGVNMQPEENRRGPALRFRLNASMLYKTQSLPFSVGVMINDDGSASVEL